MDNDVTVARMLLQQLRSKRFLEKIEKAAGVLHAEVRIKVLQDFRSIAFSCGVRGNEPEISRGIAYARLPVAIVAVRWFVERGSAGLQSSRVNIVSVFNVEMQSGRHSAPSRAGFREFDHCISDPRFRVTHDSVRIPH